jgi:hypothetical protein
MLVSAIMPTANRAAFAPLAIDCFLRQTHREAELVILDDGVTPPDVPNDPRIRYVRLGGPKRNTGAKRNACCELAAGEIVIHWDDDDWSAPNRIARQLEILLASGKQLAGFHDTLYYDCRNGKAYKYISGSKPYACGSSQCYFRSWWAQHKFQDLDVGEDTKFSSEAKYAQQAISTDSSGLLVARAHAGNTWRVELGGSNFPQIGLEELPQGFREAISKKGEEQHA